MHNSKKKIKIAVCLLLAAVILWTLDFLLYPCTFMRNDIHTACTVSHEDIFLGTSHGKMNIDPAAVEETSGRNGHNLCVGGEYGVDAFYLTKLLIEKQKPSRIIYEIDPGYFVTEKEPGNNYLLFYHEFPISAAKLSYFADSIVSCDFRTILFPWYEYPLKYETAKLKDTVWQKWNRNYDISYLKGQAQEYHENGFIERYPVDTNRIKPTSPKLFTKEGLKEENIQYLKKIIALCHKENMEFVAVTTPVPEATLRKYNENYEQAWDYFEQLFEDENVRYLNFNREYRDEFSHELSAYTDYDGHMNGEAARDYSRKLGELLEK